MGKIEVSNFLRMIAFGLVIISFYSKLIFFKFINKIPVFI